MGPTTWRHLWVRPRLATSIFDWFIHLFMNHIRLYRRYGRARSSAPPSAHSLATVGDRGWRVFGVQQSCCTGVVCGRWVRVRVRSKAALLDGCSILHQRWRTLVVLPPLVTSSAPLTILPPLLPPAIGLNAFPPIGRWSWSIHPLKNRKHCAEPMKMMSCFTVICCVATELIPRTLRTS